MTTQPTDIRWTIQLFGELCACNGSGRITRFATHKTAHLLAYLAYHREQIHAREALIDLLWPGCDLTKGRNSLNNLLSNLRRLLEPTGTARGSVVLADHTYVHLNLERLTTDVAAFERLLNLAEQTTEDSARRNLLSQACTLYKGGLLPGYYDAWVSLAQQRLSEQYARACRMLARDLAKEGAVELALEAIGAALKADPYHEASYLLQMRLYAALEQPAAVQQSYQRLERVFREELGVAPSAKAREWVNLLRQGAKAVMRTREETRTHGECVPASVPRGSDEEMPGLTTSPSLSLSFAPCNLPMAFTRFFGREEQRSLLQEWLTDSERHLITLTGPGGSGKTRLAIEVARDVAPTFSGRVWFVDLASLQDGHLLSFALAHTLNLPLSPQSDPFEQIVEKLQEGASLLVLDNFEHLLRMGSEPSKSERAVSGVSALLVLMLLERVAGLKCMVTSRQPLHLGGEQELSVPALAVPTVTVMETPERLMDYSGVAMYVDRAKAVIPDFVLTEQNAEAVVALCRKLEGMPLAIEMAAAWTKTLPPAKMLERLEHQLDLLVSRRRDLPARQQSLRATFEWSYDLLEPDLQRCFARLSVFRGGFDIEAAEALCGSAALEWLDQLKERSLVLCEEVAGEEEVRYRLLESLREYAAEKLEESGELEPTQQQHAEYFLALVKMAEPKLRGVEQVLWLGRLDRENDNLRAVLEWCRGAMARAEIGIGMCGALLWFWILRGEFWEGKRWFSEALAWTKSRGRAEALYGLGWLAYSQGDYAEARSYLKESLFLQREMADKARIAATLNILGNVGIEMGDYQEARTYLEESLSLRQEMGDKIGIASALSNIGNTHLEQGNYVDANTHYEKSQSLWKEIGDKAGIAATLSNLGHVVFEQGDIVTAHSFYKRSLFLRQEIGQKAGTASSLASLGRVALAQGNYSEAQACYTESLSIWKEIGNKGGIAYCLEGHAYVATGQEQEVRGVRLMAAAERLRREIGAPLPPKRRSEFDLAVVASQQLLGGEAFAEAWAVGRQMTLAQAIAEGLAS